MKALNVDAVRKLYRGKYAPAKEGPEINGAPIRGISFRISAAFAVLAAVSDRETVKLIRSLRASAVQRSCSGKENKSNAER